MGRLDCHGAEARALPRSLRTYLEPAAARCTVLGDVQKGPRHDAVGLGSPSQRTLRRTSDTRRLDVFHARRPPASGWGAAGSPVRAHPAGGAPRAVPVLPAAVRS